jgi:hypothetical protein
MSRTEAERKHERARYTSSLSPDTLKTIGAEVREALQIPAEWPPCPHCHVNRAKATPANPEGLCLDCSIQAYGREGMLKQSRASGVLNPLTKQEMVARELALRKPDCVCTACSNTKFTESFDKGSSVCRACQWDTTQGDKP